MITVVPSEVEKRIAQELEIDLKVASGREKIHVWKLSRCCIKFWLDNRDVSPCAACLRDIIALGFVWEFPDGKVISS